MAGKLIAFEGLDASGKSTQVNLLRKALRSWGIKHEFISFPRTNERGYGEAIAMFLRGEFGSVREVSPYLVAILFAGDRATAKPQIEEWLQAGKLVIADRYLYSNLAFQGAKIVDLPQKLRFRTWVRRLELEVNKIPSPALTVFFDVPFSFVKNNIMKRRTNEQRRYLKGRTDIHEAALDLQRDVAVEYRSFAADDPAFVTIRRGGRHEALDVHRDVISALRARQLLKGVRVP